MFKCFIPILENEVPIIGKKQVSQRNIASSIFLQEKLPVEYFKYVPGLYVSYIFHFVIRVRLKVSVTLMLSKMLNYSHIVWYIWISLGKTTKIKYFLTIKNTSVLISNILKR